MSPHPLTNLEIQKHQDQPKFNGVYPRNNLSKIKDGEYIINLDEYESIGTHWIALYANAKNVTYFDSFAVEHIPKEIKNFIGNKKYYNKYLQSTSIRFNNVWIFLYQIYWNTKLFFPNDYEKNYKMMLKYFQ